MVTGRQIAFSLQPLPVRVITITMIITMTVSSRGTTTLSVIIIRVTPAITTTSTATGYTAVAVVAITSTRLHIACTASGITTCGTAVMVVVTAICAPESHRKAGEASEAAKPRLGLFLLLLLGLETRRCHRGGGRVLAGVAAVMLLATAGVTTMPAGAAVAMIRHNTGAMAVVAVVAAVGCRITTVTISISSPTATVVVAVAVAATPRESKARIAVTMSGNVQAAVTRRRRHRASGSHGSDRTCRSSRG